MVRSACKLPILQHPIPIRHLINLRKLQNIEVRRNAVDQNEKKKKKKDQKRPTPKTKPPVPLQQTQDPTTGAGEHPPAGISCVPW
jgi:hypothetical protein